MRTASMIRRLAEARLVDASAAAVERLERATGQCALPNEHKVCSNQDEPEAIQGVHCMALRTIE